MNAIFTDIDGALCTFNRSDDKDIEERIKILSCICHTYDCKVVISSSHKEVINKKTLTSEVEWIQFILDCFKKYDIDCLGTTPKLGSDTDDIWKEDEILAYLDNHPEIEHYVIIDDVTTDVDNITDIELIERYLRIGGEKMVKCEVINQNVTIKEFNRLKNIKRIKSNNEIEQANSFEIGDTFETDEDFASYLAGEKPNQPTVCIKVLEVIPEKKEEIKEEKKVEIKPIKKESKPITKKSKKVK